MLRGYGGGEPYIDILAWMMGDEVYLHPDMYSAHFALTRSRGYDQGGPIVMARNYILAWYILGGLKWANLIRDNAVNKNRERHPDWTPKFYEAFNEAVRWGRFRRKQVEETADYTLEELLRKFKNDNIP